MTRPDFIRSNLSVAEVDALKAEVSRLAAENASLRERGRVAEIERDAALAKFAEETADIERERDRLIEGCISSVYIPCEGYWFGWKLNGKEGQEKARGRAIAAVRAAAGLSPAEKEAKCPT